MTVSYQLSAGGWRGVFCGQGVDDLYGFDADANDLADEAADVFARRRDCWRC
jgi:hypothetical protein